MENYYQTVTYLFNKVLSKYDITCLQNRLDQIEGIKSFETSAESIHVEYLSYRLTEASVHEIIESAGYSLKNEKKKSKGSIRRFIDSLAKANLETYGNKKPDCCNIKQ